MPVFWRDNANYVAPPGYITSGGVGHWGHSPIDLTLTALTAHWFDDDSLPNEFQVKVDEVPLGTILYLSSNSSGRVDLDAIAVPKVTAANVNGASRFGIRSLQVDDTEMVALAYQPTNDADAGKEVCGIGAAVLMGAAASSSNGAFSPPVIWGVGTPGGWGTTNSPVFATYWELTDDSPTPGGGQVDGVAAVPLCRPITLDDFMVVLRGDPDGTYRVHVRVEGVTVKTLEVTVGTTRVWSFAGTVDIPEGQRWCLQYEGVDGVAGLDGEILWTSRTRARTLGPGAGESAGESIP